MSNSHIDNLVNAVVNKISAVVNNHNSSSNAHSSLLSDYLQRSDVKDNLTSNNTDQPLSAKQGKELKTLIDSKEDKSNKVTSISSSSTDTQYPSAKCVYDNVKDKLEETTQKTITLSEDIGKYTRIGEYVTVTGSGGKTITENGIQCAGIGVRRIQIELDSIVRISNADEITLAMQNTVGTITMIDNKDSDDISLPNEFSINMEIVNGGQILNVDIVDTNNVNVYTWESMQEASFPTITLEIYTSNQAGTLYITEPSNTISAIAGTSTQMNAIANIIYPVGSIYMSVNATSPETLFGGVWEQLKDRFLLGSGDTYSAGTTGGEATHTLTTNEMPSHTHIQNSHNHSQNAHSHYGRYDDNSYVMSETTGASNKRVTAVSSGSVYVDTAGSAAFHHYNSTGSTTATNNSQTATNQNTGGGQAHNNMPPYMSVYMWKRTA